MPLDSLTTPQLAALGVLLAYFTLITGLFVLISRSLLSLKNNVASGLSTTFPYAFTTLTVVSFGHTWYYMFSYMNWSFADYETRSSILKLTSANLPLLERVANWLVHTALFEQAWSAVCVGVYNWWWSEQLCLFTAGAWTVFLFVESRRYSIPHVWAYMLLGQVVAISVASNLFYLAVFFASNTATAPITNPKQTAPFRLWLPVLTSLVTIYYSPSLTETPYFLPNLLGMHALLVIPLLFPGKPTNTEKSGRLDIPLSALYTTIAISSFTIRLPTVIRALTTATHSQTGIASSLFQTLHSHPAQSSIGYDVVWTSVSFLVWRIHTAPDVGAGVVRVVGKLFNVSASAAGMVVVGVGVVAPADLAVGVVGPRAVGVREGEGEEDDDDKME